MHVIGYSEDIGKRIKNIESLPRGTGAKFLICIHGEGTDLVAKRWAKKMPKALANNEAVVTFDETKGR